MKWTRQGLIFAPDGAADWMQTHAGMPIADAVSDRVLRIYFTSRDGQGRSRPGCLDVDAGRPSTILRVAEHALLPLGPPGTFDDSGVLPTAIVTVGGRKYLYYVGWNRLGTVPYHLSIGLATSDDGGATFAKVSAAPLLDRSREDPFFVTAPCVLLTGGAWRMWYVSCTGWQRVHERFEPSYVIKCADSTDGLTWRRSDAVCIDREPFGEACGRPFVLVEDGLFKMFYSVRGMVDYRTDPRHSYRLGYAESADGRSWTRKDALIGLTVSADGWDSQMIEYCCVHRHRDRVYLFYNGNGFGQTGFGYAMLTEA